MPVKRERIAVWIKPKGFRFKRKVYRYYMVGRENGRFVAKRKWSPKKLNKETAVRRFKKFRTFDENISKKKIRFSDRVINRGAKPYEQVRIKGRQKRIPTKFRFRYYFKANVGDTKITLSGSSRTMHWESVEDARDEAEKNFHRIVADYYFGTYDESDFHMVKGEIKNIEEGVIYEATASS